MENEINILLSETSNEDLADLIHNLSNELETRQRKLPGNWLRKQLDRNSLTVRSWSSSRQNAMKNSFR